MSMKKTYTITVTLIGERDIPDPVERALLAGLAEQARAFAHAAGVFDVRVRKGKPPPLQVHIDGVRGIIDIVRTEDGTVVERHRVTSSDAVVIATRIRAAYEMPNSFDPLQQEDVDYVTSEPITYEEFVDGLIFNGWGVIEAVHESEDFYQNLPDSEDKLTSGGLEDVISSLRWMSEYDRAAFITGDLEPVYKDLYDLYVRKCGAQEVDDA